MPGGELVVASMLTFPPPLWRTRSARMSTVGGDSSGATAHDRIQNAARRRTGFAAASSWSRSSTTFMRDLVPESGGFCGHLRGIRARRFAAAPARFRSPPTDPAMPLTYSSYLKLDELLSLQRPASDGPEH